MNLLYSVLGAVAVASDKMSRFRVNFIPSNWGIIAVSGFFGIFSLYALFADKDISGLYFGLPVLIIALLFITCLLTRNTIFQPRAAAGATVSAGAGQAEPFAGAATFAGKLHLQEKVARRFTAVPAQIITLENGALAVASNIDASSRLYGVVTKARAGTWLSVPREGTLQIEEGLFYYGFAGRPALRLSFEEELDGRKASAILAFDSAAQCGAARALLARGEAPQSSLNPAFSS